MKKPAEEVFAYATDPRRFSEWQDGVVNGSMESRGARAVGDLCRSVPRIGGAERLEVGGRSPGYAAGVVDCSSLLVPIECDPSE
jgi:hypothetical protein